MTDRKFLDTNILIYAAQGPGKDESKRQRSLQLIDEASFVISAQVLQEFYVTVVYKAKTAIGVQEAFAWVEQLSLYPCEPITGEIVRIAIDLSSRYQISYWDAAIIAAAQAAGCSVVYSEDLNHGQIYDQVKVKNPYLLQ